jgi:hypothetical protein
VAGIGQGPAAHAASFERGRQFAASTLLLSEHIAPGTQKKARALPGPSQFDAKVDVFDGLAQ